MSVPFQRPLLPGCLLLGLLAGGLCLLGCGYRPVASVVQGQGRSIRVPAFISYVGYPELDVFAATYLGTRLAAHGFTVTSLSDNHTWTLQGVLLRASERATVTGDQQSLVTVSVSLQLSLVRSQWRCTPPVAVGEAVMAVPRGVIWESDRLGALEVAVANAIDSRMLDVVLCLEDDPERGGR